MKKGFSIPTIAFALFLSLLASPAIAGKYSAVVNGKSYHFNSTYQWNENNYGFGVEHEFTQKSAWKRVAMVNGFRDSTRVFETDKLAGFYIYAGINAFVMTRDDVSGGRPFPGLLPSISIGNDKMGLNLTYMPKQAVEATVNANMVDPTLSGILFLQFKVSMDQLLP
jgi:hypothetical protein